VGGYCSNSGLAKPLDVLDAEGGACSLWGRARWCGFQLRSHLGESNLEEVF